MMDRLRRTLSFRKKKPIRDEAEDWLEDERKVREGECCFQVKYLGCIEVLEGTGLRVCEEAMKQLRQNAKKSERLSFRKKRRPCPVMAMLYVCGDSLRLVELGNVHDRKSIYRDENQGLIVDQAVEKVSFCAPDRQHLKAFSYICRDSTTRRWMCHGFVTLKETGERLSHAVGCAFGVCLESKQQREKEQVEATYNSDRTSFVRQGSFKQASLTERMLDPQSVMLTEPSNAATSTNTSTVPDTCVQRPRPATDLFTRHNSATEFPKLNSTSSAFKRTASLRLEELPSTIKRQAEDAVEPAPHAGTAEDGQAKDLDWDPISALCRQLTEGLFSSDANDNTELAKATPATASGDAVVSTVQVDCLPAADLEPTQMFSPNIQPLSLDATATMRALTNPFTAPLPSTNPFHVDQTSSPEFVLNM